jgi:hypothetical protein
MLDVLSNRHLILKNKVDYLFSNDSGLPLLKTAIK